VIDRGAESGAFDGQDMLAGEETLWWNSALRFAVGPGAFAGGYDANGNLTSRVVDGEAYLLSYDADGSLTGVSGAASAAFVYDGDGNRVKGTVNGTTTVYVGNYFEWTGSADTMVKYYYAGEQRVAMRQGASTVYYLLSDHLGSTSRIVTSSGSGLGELRYKPWGKTLHPGQELELVGYLNNHSEN
jgi:YD repeat-containing protein